MEESLAQRTRLSEDVGHIVLFATSGAAKKKPDNVASWLKAWLVNCSVVFEGYSDRASELIAYQLRIV